MVCVSAHRYRNRDRNRDIHVSVSQSLCISLPLYLSVCLSTFPARVVSAEKCRSHPHRFNRQRLQPAPSMQRLCLKIYTKVPFPLYIHYTSCSVIVSVIHYGVCMFRPYTLSCNNTPLPSTAEC